MSTQEATVRVQNPQGYELQPSTLQEFERGLDLLNPQASRIPCHVLGYGEISTEFEIQQHSCEGLAFKRMGCFETLDELKPYVDTYLAYNRALENGVGLHLPPYGYALFVCDTGRPVFYIIQQRPAGLDRQQPVAPISAAGDRPPVPVRPAGAAESVGIQPDSHGLPGGHRRADLQLGDRGV